MDTDPLVELEHAGWRSLCNGTGSDFYGSTMTEDALMVLANGMVLDRRGVVAALASAPSWASYAMSDVRVVPLGAHAAAVVYTAQATREDGSEFVGSMSSVYTRADDGWRLGLYQQTEVQR